MTNLNYVQVITTGGTIASLPDSTGDVSAQLSGNDLVERLGVTGHIKVKSSVMTGSYAFDYSTLFEVAIDVEEALLNPDVSGVVITHGTDTMEETAFYLSLVTRSCKKPTILTGAQLDASYTFSDGIKNLQDAIYAAKTSQLGKLGPLIVFAGFIYAARDVNKVDTHALEGFYSPNWGAVGRVDQQQVVISGHAGGPIVEMKPIIPTPVALIRLGIGMTGEELKSMVHGYPGVVIEAFGRGNSHLTIPDVVKTLVQNEIPVIITSRCMRGSVKPIYGKGGGTDLKRAGAWFAGDLSGVKARILLGVMLAHKMPWSEMKSVVDQMSHSSVTV